MYGRGYYMIYFQLYSTFTLTYYIVTSRIIISLLKMLSRTNLCHPNWFWKGCVIIDSTILVTIIRKGNINKSIRILLLTSFMATVTKPHACSSNVFTVGRVIAAINTKIDIIPALISLSSAPKDQQLMT